MSSPENDSNFERIWRDLKEGIEKIYSNNISKSDYFRLYALVYDICTSSKYGSTASNSQLYTNLTFFLRGHLEAAYNKCKDLNDEPLLSLYIKLWQAYRSSSKLMNGVCAYLNRYWVSFEREKNRVDVLDVYHLALVSWKEYLLDPLKKSMSNAVLKLIKLERNGEIVDNSLIGTALNSYIEMGIDLANPYSDQPCLYLYKEAFEEAFFAETELFYDKESSSVRNIPVSKLMQKIESWFIEERARVQKYLHENTLEPLMQILERFLIRKHMDIFHSEFKKLLEYNETEDLASMYQILFLVPGGLDQLRIQFEEYVTEAGLSAIEKCKEYDVIDPKDYINTILDIYRIFNCIVMTAFENEASFVNALDRACEKFINRNAVTERSKSSIKSAYLLAKYCDILLKKKYSDSGEEEMMDNVNNAMIVFKYIEEKDIFKSFYGQMLARRLVLKMNVRGHDEAETLMITKLRDVCGYEYTAKLQRMFQDVSVSQDLIENFKNEEGPDFNIIVFRSTSWPLIQSLTFSLPQELEQSVQKFTKFYCSRFNGRKLTWLHGMSRGELVSNCFDKPYIFKASTFQMAVLLQFNTQLTMTFKQLEESTAIQSDILLQLLEVFARFKLLKDANNNPITASSLIVLNVSYRNKKLKVNINFPIKYEKRSQHETVDKHVDEDRKRTVQAAIVRIAKTQKVIQHEILLSEVLRQLSQFKPTIPMIKKCIEILIEKEYLERVGNNSYCYLA